MIMAQNQFQKCVKSIRLRPYATAGPKAIQFQKCVKSIRLRPELVEN